ncbi:uncharacterized protein [Gossypium hirsutum]|uniref:Uncharacterized protein n=1 Tax=Gossypium hirsutum TaxID=3635 RepID=A0ABM2ZJH1_GOSHI|nr:uncharacterized protein LOC121213588 [Gossypium hirsutum]
MVQNKNDLARHCNGLQTTSFLIKQKYPNQQGFPIFPTKLKGQSSLSLCRKRATPLQLRFRRSEQGPTTCFEKVFLSAFFCRRCGQRRQGFAVLVQVGDASGDECAGVTWAATTHRKGGNPRIPWCCLVFGLYWAV